MWLPVKVFFTTLHVLALPLHLCSVLLLILYKRIVCLFALLFKNFVGPIPSTDNVFLADHIWSRPHSSIVVGVELSGTPSTKDIAKIFENIYNFKDAAGKRYYRELGYSLVIYGGHGFWKEVPNFSTLDRVHLLPNAGQATSEVPITSIMEGLMRQGYDKHQPLWDVFMVPNYNNGNTMAIIRFHHLMSDGVSFVKLFYALTGSKTLPSNFTKAAASMEKWNQLRNSFFLKLRTSVALATVGFVDYVYQILIAKNRHSFYYTEKGKLKINGNWIVSLGKKINLSEVKRFSKSNGCSISHLLLVGLSNALEIYFHKYHSHSNKYPIPKGVHIVVPVPIPNHPDLRLVNHWCLSKIYAKFGIERTVDKLKHFQEEVKRSANSTFTTMTALTFVYICGLLPSFLTNLLSKSKAAFTVTVSNIVGPQDNESLACSTVLDMFFFMPIVQESTALAVGIVSCNGGLRFCLTADAGCVPDKSRLDDLGLMIYEEINDICNERKSIDMLDSIKL